MDTNNHGPFSTDDIGRNYDYPDATYERRREILKAHENYQKGWLYFIANDPRVPKDAQEKMQRWGLAKDEFKDNGNWPHQIYVREARRMIGAFVMTENELMQKTPTLDSIGMGSYGIDSHNVQRYVTPDGSVQNEGDVGVGLKSPYAIAYGSLIPRRGQCSNLLVPVCVSSSHIAFGSIRMESVFMILGQSAATAACMAIDGRLAVQDVDYPQLRTRLLADKQILEYAVPAKKADAAAVKCAEELKSLHFGMFIPWSLSTFSGKDETIGVKDLSLFNPTGCDVEQWVSVGKEAGMGYFVFCAKTADGFCLWDTKTTDRKVTKNPRGKDVFAAARAACEKDGVKFAFSYEEGDWTWPGAVDGGADWPGATKGQRYPSGLIAGIPQAGGNNPQVN
jgi:hypothetical protein